MAEQQQQHAPGGHYSGANPVPTVKKFLESLDKEKQERDRAIEQQGQQPQTATPHKQHPRGIKGTQKEVTDPTTGRQVVIEDVNRDVMKEVDNPKVSAHALQLCAIWF